MGVRARSWVIRKCRVCASFPVYRSFLPIIDSILVVAAWKHSFAAECQSLVHDQAFGAKTPSYSTIQELDSKVKNWYVPPSLQVPGFGNSKIGPEVEQPSIELTLQRYIAFAIKEISQFFTPSAPIRLIR